MGEAPPSGVARWLSCCLESMRCDAAPLLAGLWRRVSSFRKPEYTPVLQFLEVDPDWQPKHANRSTNTWRQLASLPDWKSFLDDVNFEVTVPVGVVPFDFWGKVECEYWFEQKGAHEPGQRYVIVHVHYFGTWSEYKRYTREVDPATGAPYRLYMHMPFQPSPRSLPYALSLSLTPNLTLTLRPIWPQAHHTAYTTIQPSPRSPP